MTRDPVSQTTPSSPGGSGVPGGFNARRVLRMAVKELRETLRDRRTIATLVLMPILVYPLLSVVFQRFLASNIRVGGGVTEFVFALPTEQDAKEIGPVVAEGHRLVTARYAAESDQAAAPLHPPSKYLVTTEPERAIRDGQADVGVKFQRSAANGSRKHGGSAFELTYDPQSPLSTDAVRWIELRLHAINEDRLEQALRAKGKETEETLQTTLAALPPDPTASRRGGPSLVTLVPLILILMTITGAVYPAIDLTAGERERGTLEMLVAAPVPRMQLLLAKYIAVLTVAVLTATLNMAAMFVTVSSVGLTGLLFGDAGLSPLMLAEIASLLVLFAAFFSAVLLAVTSFARSFKEAQAYLIPLMLLSIAPGTLSMIPDLKLRGPLAVTPLVNIVLLTRDVLRHAVEPAPAVWAVISTCFFALAAIAIAARLFGTDAILYGSHGTWTEAFQRPAKMSDTPTATTALFCLALMFPAYFLTSNQLARSDVGSLEGRLALAALVTILVFVLIPLAAAVLNRLRLRTAFQAQPATVLAFVGAALLGVSLWPFAHQAIVLLSRWSVVELPPEILQRAQQLLDRLRQVSPFLVVGMLAIVPATCEELFFRGFLLSALRRTLSDRQAILVSGVLFGLFHLIATDQLHWERLIPSTLLGFVLGWLCVRSGSVFPGMLMHALHNGLLLLGARYQKELAARGWGIEATADFGTASLPWTWLAMAGVVASLGFAVVWAGTRGRDPTH